jgi:predicted ATPase/DNA-binding winged helix-turn-helix (wHTH) protein
MEEAHEVRFGGFRLDLASERLWQGAAAVRLRPKSFAVLRYLVAQPSRVVTKDALLQAVWPDTAVSEAALTVCLNELRQALGETAQAPQCIETVHRRGYRFIAPVTRVAPAEALPVPAPVTPVRAPAPALRLVGREAECARLHGWLEQARHGMRQVGFVTGEAGIGKTTLVDAFLAQVAHEPGLWVGRGQCLDHYGAGEAYLPVLEALGRLCRGPGGASLLQLLGRYAPTWLLQLPAFLSEADLEALQHRTAGATPERMLREMVEAVEAVTAERLLILVLEDLHWSDHATLNLIAYLARRREPARLLLLGTYRPVDVIVRDYPLKAVKQELALHRQCEELPLELLTEAAVVQYLAGRFGAGRVPDGLAQALHRRTDGQPLFVVNVVDNLVRQGLVREVQGEWEVRAAEADVAVGMPTSLRQMIATSLDGLSAEDQRLVEAASVVGASFSAAAVAAALGEDVDTVEERCGGLARRGQFLQASGVEEWPDGTVAEIYRFLHALYQEVVYDRLSARQRIRLHHRIGEREETGYGAQAGERAAALALHFEQGRDYTRALQYLQQAAQNALRRAASQEAIGHLTRGLEVLKALPATPERTMQEIALQTTLGAASIAVKGQASPEVEQAYTRARELCQQVGETPQLYAVLGGLRRLYSARAEHRTARDLGAQQLRLAQSVRDPALLVDAHLGVGMSAFFLGELGCAGEHLAQMLALYDPEQHRFLFSRHGHDARVTCLVYAAQALCLRGYPEQALQRSHAALALAQELALPFTLAAAFQGAAALSQMRCDRHLTQQRAEAAMTLSTASGFPFYLAHGMTLRGWALAAQGQGEAGVAQMRAGLAALQDMGTKRERPYYLALLADAYGQAGQAEAGLQVLAEALTAVDNTGERFYEAELYRLKGELLCLQTATAGRPGRAPGVSPRLAEVEACVQQALDIARGQQAKWLELRAAMSLSRLWQPQGKRAEAREILVEVYGWFTEGFDTADLQKAKALLAELT